MCAISLSIICPFIGIDTPVTVIQMLWVNMVMDTLAGLAFAFEPALLEYMEEKLGKGWWGSDAYASYYEDMGSEDDPFSYIKVIPLIGADAQIKCGGFDHAGKWETSLMMGTYPELVDLSRCDRNTEWFAESAKEASEETGKHMVNCTLEWLRKTIV